MRVFELRQAFAEAKTRGAWETCAGIAESIAVKTTSDTEAVVMNLYSSESIALLAGMPGLCANRLFGATDKDGNDPLLWEAFYDAANDLRNYALLGHATRLRISHASDDIQKAARILENAHFLRYQASENRDSVQQYAEAAQLDPDYEIAALVALHQLFRDDPLCTQAAAEIHRICEQDDISERTYDELQEELHATSPEDRETLAKIQIKLARLSLMIWGNISHAFQWITLAIDHSKTVVSQASAMIRSVGLAMIHDTAVLMHCSELLEMLGDWQGAVMIDRLLIPRLKTRKNRVELMMRMAFDSAHVEGAERLACKYVLLAAHEDPEAWLRMVEREPWILNYAERSINFGATLLELLSQTGAKKEYSDLRDVLVGVKVSLLMPSSAELESGEYDVSTGRLVSSKLASGKLVSSKLGSGKLTSQRLESGRFGSDRLGSGRLDSQHIQSERIGSGRLNSDKLGYGRLDTSSGLHSSQIILDENAISSESEIVAAEVSSWGDDPELAWKGTVEAILQFVPYSLSWAARCPEGWHAMLESFEEVSQAFPILNDALAEMLQNRGFFQRVMQMAENEEQQHAYLEMLNKAIALFSDDTAKKTTLLVKKYKIAEILSNDRLKLVTLKEILEVFPNHRFAIEHVRSMDETNLKSHAQILLCQLQLSIASDEEEKYNKRLHMADLYVKSSQFNNAFNLYHTLIDEVPEKLEPRYRLLDLLIELENWKSAENVLLELINIEKDEKRRFDAFLKLADIQDEKMMVPSRALLTLFAALDSKMDLLPLHERLCSISERLHTYSPLIDKYEEVASHGSSSEVRGQATLMLARLYIDQVGKPAVASKILNDFFENEGWHDIAYIRQMALLCQNMKLWNDYVRVLLRIVEISSDKSEIIRATLNAAQVYAAELGDFVQSVILVRRAAEMNPDNADEWIEIAQVLALRDEYSDALNALQRALAYQTGVDKSHTLLMIAQIYGTCDDIGEATRTFHQAIQLKPEHEALVPVAQSLITLATTRHNQSAFDIICSDLIEASDESQQSTLMLQQAMELARIFEDYDGARRVVEKLEPHLAEFEFSQSCMFADILTLIHDEHGAIELNFSILKNNVLSDQQRFDRLQAMLTNATRLNDVGLIKELCTAILEIDSEDNNANFQLIQIDYMTGHWDVAASRIQRFLPYTERLSAESAVLLHYYYADILHAAEHDELAIDSLNLALSIRNDFRPAVELKLEILINHMRWKDALPSFETLLSLSHDQEEKGAIHKRIAEVWHFYLDNPQRAILEYEQALTLGGDVEDVPIRLLELYRLTQDWQKAAVMAEVLASAQVSSTDARLDYLLVLGQIRERHLGDLSLAAETYLEMFTLVPLREDIVTPLTRILLRKQEFAALQGVGERLIDLSRYEFDDSLTMLKIMFKMCSACAAARPILEQILVTISARYPHKTAVDDLQAIFDNPPANDEFVINLPPLVGPNDAQTSENEPIPERTDSKQRSRKRTITNPLGSLTVDSGLLNPSFDSGLFSRATLDSGVHSVVNRMESGVVGRPVISDSGLQARPACNDVPEVVAAPAPLNLREITQPRIITSQIVRTEDTSPSRHRVDTAEVPATSLASSIPEQPKRVRPRSMLLGDLEAVDEILGGQHNSGSLDEELLDAIDGLKDTVN